MPNDMYKDLLIKIIDSKSAVVGIIGLGYVGLPLVIRFSEEGFRAIGFDIDKEKVEKLNKGESYLKHIPSSSIDAAANNGFSATSDWEIDFHPMQPGDVPESFADIDKSVARLGYKSTTNVDIGIQKFVKWYKKYYA